jgi:hypothetical protein
MSHLRNALSSVNLALDVAGSRLLLPKHSRLAALVAEMDQQEGVLKPPAGLQELHDRLVRARSEANWNSVTSRDWRDSPYVFAWDAPGSSLGEDPVFLKRYLDYFDRGRKARDVRRLIAAFFLGYSSRSSCSLIIASEIRSALENNMSSSLTRWRDRQGRYSLFSDAGPVVVASYFLAAGEAYSEFTKETGIAPNDSPFLRETFEQLIKIVSTRLGPSGEGAGLKRLWDWLIVGRELRYNDVRSLGQIADTLLAPWQSTDPNLAVQLDLTDFFFKYYNHPRLRAGNWQYVSESAIATVMRWNARRTIDDFFKILDASAPVEQWSYRNAFWSSYVNRHHIFEAWPVFGRIATSKARSLFKGTSQEGQFGELVSGNPDQSVLLIRIDRLVIVEWSHNGQCWILGDGRQSPKFYERVYLASELRGFNSEGVRHDGKERGQWQGEVQNRIRDLTGIRMLPADYMPRGR